MTISTLSHNTPDYDKMIALRMDILRKPLGLSFTPEQLADEKKDILVGAFEEDELVGCCVLTAHDEQKIQLRQMAIREHLQGKGIGKKIVAFAEKTAVENGYSILLMHARNTAIGFYRQCGYEVEGNEFTEVGIPHHYMEKKL